MTKKLTIDAFCCLDNAKLGIKYLQRKHCNFLLVFRRV